MLLLNRELSRGFFRLSMTSKTPYQQGFRIPAEWERREATWLAWPHNPEDWPGKFAAIPWLYVEIVRLLAAHERVHLIVEDAAMERRALRLYNARRQAARIGLSSAHISPRHSWAECSPDGAYLAVHRGRTTPCPVPGTTRGSVHGFSRQSRGRLLRTLAKVGRNASARALFVTLTYPSWWTTCPAGVKRHLDSFVKRAQRRFPTLSLVWRLELTTVGTPHFHCIVFGLEI